MLSWEGPLRSCARKPILESLCFWENTAQTWKQKLRCSSHSYKTLPWGSTTWVGMNGTKAHFNQWSYADMLWIKQRNLGLYWCLQGWPWGGAVPGEQKRRAWISVASVTRRVAEPEKKHAWLYIKFRHGPQMYEIFQAHVSSLTEQKLVFRINFSYIHYNLYICVYIYTHILRNLNHMFV